MMQSWKELVKYVSGKRFTVREIHIPSEEIAIQGEFEPPPLAYLSNEDQAFISSFLAYHGSMKKMRELLGISYPAVKSRLNKLVEAIGAVTPSTE